MSESRNPDDQSMGNVEGQRSAQALLRASPSGAQLNLKLIADLYQSTIGNTALECESLLLDALNAGVTQEDIADLYIPTVARMLGDAWCSDETSFAQVTIGVARLRGALRVLGPAWLSDEQAPADASTILLATAKGAQHTLGATILAGQLRRSGISVRLCIDAAPNQVHGLVSAVDFDAVWLSASIGENLETLRQIVESVRKGTGVPIPVVLGGTIVADERSLVKLTGANFVSVDLCEAIDFCGLKTNRQDARSSQSKTTGGSAIPQRHE